MDTITSCALRYVATRRASREIAAHTANRNRLLLLHFAETVGMKRPIDTITRVDIETWFAARSERVQTSTLRLDFTTLRGFFAWCVDMELITRTPCAGIKGPKAPESTPRAMTDEQVGRVLDACADSRERLILSMMVQEGLRCVEVTRLTDADIDLPNGVMHVSGKGGRNRWMPMTSSTRDALFVYLQEHPLEPGCPVVRNARTPHLGIGANYVSRLVSRVMYAAGVKREARDGTSAHALRHTFASGLVEDGVDIEDVRLAMGHAALSSTAVYTKKLRASDRLRTIMEARHYPETVTA